jgi:pyruvate-formate lyase-activating enzyme
MRMLKEHTLSLCDVCYSEVPARVFEKNGQVFIQKQCPQHGSFEAIVEEDAQFYQRFAHLTSTGFASFDTLIIPITFRCNLDCSYCFAPQVHRQDIPLPELAGIIRNFAGPAVFLSGGEPTLREDLKSIILEIKAARKCAGIVTNGVRLADESYLHALRKAGLDYVFFSFDSFTEKFYRALKAGSCGAGDLLRLKKRALANLEIERVPTVLSATIHPGLNDHELKELLVFAMRKRGFIVQLRLRSCVQVGRFGDSKGHFLSKLLSLLSEQLDIDKKTLLAEYLSAEYHSIHHITLDIQGYLAGSDLVPYVGSRSGKNTSDKLRFAVSLGKKKGAAELLSAVKAKYLRHEPVVRTLSLRLIRWPTIENVDLQEVDRGVAYLCDNGRILNFCHALILDARHQESSMWRACPQDTAS